MSLLNKLKKKKESTKAYRDINYMHIAVFDSALYRLGVDSEAIKQHKKEPPETWEATLKKYEQYGNREI